MQFVQLHSDDGSWDEFLKDWRDQCEKLDEDFSTYETSPLGVVRDLAVGDRRKEAAVFALKDETGYHAICQANRTLLPGMHGMVLRIRMMYFSPSYDFGEKKLEEYQALVICLFQEIIKLSDGEMKSPHIKFHLRSPADMPSFAWFGAGLDTSGKFASVTVKGTWLYITKN